MKASEEADVEMADSSHKNNVEDGEIYGEMSDEVVDINEVESPNQKKNKNYTIKNILYKPYYEENVDPNDKDLAAKVKEIELLMASIKLNDSNKSEIRNMYENKITKVKNRKESHFNNSFLLFFLNSFSISTVKKKLINKNFKINLILDIDSTLLFADSEQKVKDNVREGAHSVCPIIRDNPFKLLLKLRKNSINLIKRLNEICNIFIYTHGHEAYAHEVVKVLISESGINISNDNIIGVKPNSIAEAKNLKYFSEDPHFKANSLIIDDNVKAWVSENYGNIIQSMKYLSFIPSIKFDDRQFRAYDPSGCLKPLFYSYLLNYYRVIDCNEIQSQLVDENDAPFSVEYDYSSTNQLEHLIEIIENIYKSSVLREMSAEESLRNIRQNVLIGITINLRFSGLDEQAITLLKEIISVLGGRNDDGDSVSTHYIISNIQLNEFLTHRSRNSQIFNKKRLHCLKVKWLFHCFFFIKKMNENDSEYKVIL